MRRQLRDFLTTNGVGSERVDAMIEKIKALGLNGIDGLEFIVGDYETHDAVQQKLVQYRFEPIEADILVKAVCRLRSAPAAALQPPSTAVRSGTWRLLSHWM